MEKTRMGLKIAPVWGLLIVLCAGTLASAARIYAPPYLWNRGIASKTNPRDIADTYLGMRYRDDGLFFPFPVFFSTATSRLPRPRGIARGTADRALPMERTGISDSTSSSTSRTGCHGEFSPRMERKSPWMMLTAWC